MIDFKLAREQKINVNELAASLSLDDLRDLTNEMIDHMLILIAECTDDDIVFQPIDPDAEDPYAEDTDQANLAWTLAHVIVHATASSEEAAFLAAEMARGVENHGRSRYEVPWETVTTIDGCRKRLEESRRIRLASLELWPHRPNLRLMYQTSLRSKPVNAKGRFVLGLRHDDTHLKQIAEIVRQATNARLLTES